MLISDCDDCLVDCGTLVVSVIGVYHLIRNDMSCFKSLISYVVFIDSRAVTVILYAAHHGHHQPTS